MSTNRRANGATEITPQNPPTVERADADRDSVVVPFDGGGIFPGPEEVMQHGQRTLDAALNGAVGRDEYKRLLGEYKSLFQDLVDSEQRSNKIQAQMKRSLQEFQGLSQVVEAINSSQDLDGMLDLIIDRSVRLGDGDAGAIYTLEPDNRIQLRGAGNADRNLLELLKRSEESLNDSPVAVATATKEIVQVRDLRREPEHPLRDALLAAGFRALLVMPLMRDGEALGALVIRKRQPGPFADRAVSLLKTFARQSSLAIHNVRLNGRLLEKIEDQAATVRRLKRFFSGDVVDWILQPDTEPRFSIERRFVSVVFCDFRGWTDLNLRTEPEYIMQILDEYHHAIGNIINKYPATVERFTGDGLMVFFNAPKEVVEPSLQAVRMAIEMRERMRDLIDAWKARDHNLGFGMGIDQGFVSTGTVGFEGRYDYAAVGSAVNRASRLCGEAADGQILVSRRVHADVHETIELEPIGEIDLKGLGSTTAFNVIALRPQAAAENGAADIDPGSVDVVAPSRAQPIGDDAGSGGGAHTS